MLKSFNNGVGGVSGTMPGGGRRRANYRQHPHPQAHRCPVQRMQLDISSSTIGSTEPRKKPKLLSSPIRKYQTQTTFAAAIAAPRKKHRVHRMSSPLLGAAGPPHHIKRTRLGSFRDSVSNSLSTKNLALPSSCSSAAASHHCNNPKKRSIMCTIQKNMSTSLARVSSKINLKRGGKSTSTKQDENYASSDAAVYEEARFGSENNTSQSLNSNTTLQNGTVDENAKEQDTTVGHFISLEPDQFEWSTLLSFDDADITNHFRRLDSGEEVGVTQHDNHMTDRSTPSPYTEGFSLQRALSPVACFPSLCLDDFNITEEEEVEEEEIMSCGGVVKVCKPVPVCNPVPMPLEDEQENKCFPEDQEDCSNSYLSLPSLSGKLVRKL